MYVLNWILRNWLKLDSGFFSEIKYNFIQSGDYTIITVMRLRINMCSLAKLPTWKRVVTESVLLWLRKCMRKSVTIT